MAPSTRGFQIMAPSTRGFQIMAPYLVALGWSIDPRSPIRLASGYSGPLRGRVEALGSGVEAKIWSVPASRLIGNKVCAYRPIPLEQCTSTSLVASTTASARQYLGHLNAYSQGAETPHPKDPIFNLLSKHKPSVFSRLSVSPEQ